MWKPHLGNLVWCSHLGGWVCLPPMMPWLETLCPFRTESIPAVTESVCWGPARAITDALLKNLLTRAHVPNHIPKAAKHPFKVGTRPTIYDGSQRFNSLPPPLPPPSSELCFLSFPPQVELRNMKEGACVCTSCSSCGIFLTFPSRRLSGHQVGAWHWKPSEDAHHEGLW